MIGFLKREWKGVYILWLYIFIEWNDWWGFIFKKGEDMMLLNDLFCKKWCI